MSPLLGRAVFLCGVLLVASADLASGDETCRPECGKYCVHPQASILVKWNSSSEARPLNEGRLDVEFCEACSEDGICSFSYCEFCVYQRRWSPGYFCGSQNSCVPNLAKMSYQVAGGVFVFVLGFACLVSRRRKVVRRRIAMYHAQQDWDARNARGLEDSATPEVPVIVGVPVALPGDSLAVAVPEGAMREAQAAVQRAKQKEAAREELARSAPPMPQARFWGLVLPPDVRAASQRQDREIAAQVNAAVIPPGPLAPLRALVTGAWVGRGRTQDRAAPPPQGVSSPRPVVESADVPGQAWVEGEGDLEATGEGGLAAGDVEAVSAGSTRPAHQRWGGEGGEGEALSVQSL